MQLLMLSLEINRYSFRKKGSIHSCSYSLSLSHSNLSPTAQVFQCLCRLVKLWVLPVLHLLIWGGRAAINVQVLIPWKERCVCCALEINIY